MTDTNLVDDATRARPIRAHERIGLILAAALVATTELRGIDPPAMRLIATSIVVVVLAPAVLFWWRTRVGIAVVALWAVLSVSNLWSPLRSWRSVLDLTTAVLAVVLVVQMARLLGGDRLRRWLTIYATGVLAVGLAAKAASALAAGSLTLSDLKVDTTAAGMWKGVVIISPCPVRWLPARLAFLGFKVALVILMLTVDRPKIGVVLSVTLALTIGAIAILFHRFARSRNVIMMCLTILPIALVPALLVGNWLVEKYVRRSDFSGRTVLWREAIAEAERSRSILGVGYRNSLTSSEAVAAMSERFGGNFSAELGGNAVHNVYLQLVVEFGVVGLVLLGAVVAAAIIGLVRIPSISLQAALAVDLIFVLGLCVSEPVLEPNTTIFTLICLTIFRIRWHSRGQPQRLGPSDDRVAEDPQLLGARGAR